MLDVQIIDPRLPKVSLATTNKTLFATIERDTPESDCLWIKTPPKLYVEIESEPLEVAVIIRENPGVTIVPNMVVTGGGVVPPSEEPKIFYFTANDLVNERLTKNHYFNTDVVDVTVYDQNKRMIGCDVTITPISVTLNLTRVTVFGTWTILVEKL